MKQNSNDILSKKKNITQSHLPFQLKSVSSSPIMSPFIQQKSICPCDGGCPRCLPVQTKLKIGQPNDKYEQEADRVADQVMRAPQEAPQGWMPEPPVQGLIQRKNASQFDANCNILSRGEAKKALARADLMTKAVIAELAPIAGRTITSGNVVNLLNVHFQAPSAQQITNILNNYRLILSELNASIRYSCPPANQIPDDCLSPDAIEGLCTSTYPGAEVLLLPLFPLMDTNEQAEWLIHEMAHHLGFDDHPDRQPIKNPYAYQRFARMVWGWKTRTSRKK